MTIPESSDGTKAAGPAGYSGSMSVTRRMARAAHLVGNHRVAPIPLERPCGGPRDAGTYRREGEDWDDEAGSKSETTEGEIDGAPVPGGWPDRGPFQVFGNALSRVFGRRRSGDRAEERRRPADDDREPTSADPAEHDAEK